MGVRRATVAKLSPGPWSVDDSSGYDDYVRRGCEHAIASATPDHEIHCSQAQWSITCPGRELHRAHPGVSSDLRSTAYAERAENSPRYSESVSARSASGEIRLAIRCARPDGAAHRLPSSAPEPNV